MAAPEPTAVTYIGLPIASGGAHSLARMPLREAHRRMNAFLRACTEPVAPPSHVFSVAETPQLAPQRKQRWALARRFGRGRIVRVPAERVDDALDFLDDIAPQPTNPWGMAQVRFTTVCEVRILDPSTSRPLPGQDPARYGATEYDSRMPLGASHVRVMLSNQAAVGLKLCLPDADEETLARVVPWLQSHLPFALSTAQWRQWTPTKTGAFVARKLVVPLG